MESGLMRSVWGVDHGEVSKAAWKAFYPVPPGVGKIPRSKLAFSSKTYRDGSVSHHAKTLRGKNAGQLSTGPIARDGRGGTREIDLVAVHPGFRRRNIASNLIAHGEKTTRGAIEHSASRTPNGNAFATAHAARQGTKPPELHSWSKPTQRGKKGKPVRWTVPQGKNKVIAHGSNTGRTGIERGKKRLTPLSERQWD